ncbi:MAG: tetratricopeptide repeat protein, partial [Thermoplasmata archaeon]|nr:tetratricopeptide repeat protein [Thermoplasmata archaeon]
MNAEFLLSAVRDLEEDRFEGIAIRLLEHMGVKVERHRSKKGLVEAKGTATLPDGITKRYHIHISQGGEDVTPKDIQRLVSRKMREDTEALFITTGIYGQEAKEYADEMEVRLADGESLTMLLEKYGMAEELLRPFKVAEENNENVDSYLPSVAELQEHLDNGREYFELGKYKKSLRYFNKALELKPNYSDAWRMKARCLFELGNDEEALENYKKALTMDVKNPEMWFELAEILYEMGKHDDELECYDRALALNKRFDRAWNNKGATLFEMANVDVAIECFKKAVEANPGYEEAWHNMGLAYKKKGDYKEALRSYYKVLALDKSYMDARISLINLLKEMQRYEEATDQSHIALNQERKDERLWYLAALAFKGLGRYNKAIYCA